MQRKVLYRWDFISLAASLKWSARVSLLDKVKMKGMPITDYIVTVIRKQKEFPLKQLRIILSIRREGQRNSYNFTAC